MGNEFDKILRELFRQPKMALLYQLLRDDIVKVVPLTPKMQQIVTEKEGDTVLEITNAENRRYILHIEWQSTNETKMAIRMATYDLWLYQTYGIDVQGLVLYVGNEHLRMKNSVSFFGFHYSCEIIDTKQLDPDIFLDSDDPDEIVFSILAGLQTKEEQLKIIRRILYKLQLISGEEKFVLQKGVSQLEVLSLLRGEETQKNVIKEVNIMPVTIDITKDERYKQGVEQGKLEGKLEGNLETKLEIAADMLKKGLSIDLIKEVTKLSEEQIRSMQ
jgi:predicted transposase/invertase (TIGR01784 family)